MEFGPRALGSRSIIGDARSPKMQSVMNLKIKYRESFRPFAPAVLAEDVSEYFELDRESPYMLLVALYQSWLQPLAIMFSLPVTLVGAIAGLYLTGNTLNMLSLLGIESGFRVFSPVFSSTSVMTFCTPRSSESRYSPVVASITS